ncbi:hypothetical protein DUNSADRAFT_8237 [Dunaliella salina]|uniref:Uncharacterized protein n=1 Tax=Dunaliella salina TaxID=3046 RepID=A0ABQ7HA45_DUNSA|nr:hypothetical protein DUNSADRAFT_8237 [Dunaliella salina]|eukprot:KAF5843722.1 hypothetical protein DUNSADRAFT_8237 [Dunaliella salina]
MESNAKRVAELEEQLEQLQRKLEVYHCSDVNAIRRAYRSLAQHIHALDIESRHIPTLLREIETTVLSPQIVAQEIAVAAAVAGSAWATDRGLGALRVPRYRLISQAALVAGIGLLGWHLGTRLSRHLCSVFKRNRHVKGQLLDDWAVIQRRIDVMSQLACPQDARPRQGS